MPYCTPLLAYVAHEHVLLSLFYPQPANQQATSGMPICSSLEVNWCMRIVRCSEFGGITVGTSTVVHYTVDVRISVAYNCQTIVEPHY